MDNAWKITVWCSTEDPAQSSLADALEEGRLWEHASDVQYQIEEVHGG